MYIGLFCCFLGVALLQQVNSFRVVFPLKSQSKSLLQAKRPWDVFGRLDTLEVEVQGIRKDVVEIKDSIKTMQDSMKTMQNNFYISQIPVYGGIALMIFMMMNK